MEVLLLQHAQPLPKEVNPDRPLSEKGIQDIRKVANFLNHSNWPCKRIEHSGKKRAEETASHLLDTGFLDAEVKAISGLNPNDAVKPIADRLMQESENLALVGHLPFMNKLAGLLINGDENTSPISFQQGGAVCLKLEETNWQVKWMVVPELFT